MALALGFPLILQFLVMEKEENIKHLLEVNGMKVTYYWLSTFLFFYVYLCIGSALFYVSGKLILDDALFQRLPWWEVAVFLLLWNAIQVVVSLVVSGFINSSGTATAAGFIMALMLNLFYAMVNLNVYPYPNKMPVWYKLIPLSLLSRGLIFLNIKAANAASEDEMFDHTQSLGFMALCVIIYGVAGVVVNEPRVRDWFRRILGLVSHPDFEAYSEEREKMHSSAKKESEMVDSMDSSESRSHVIVCKGVKKFYEKKGVPFPALKGLNLKIERGEIFGLLGPNGAGKTTLISIVTNFLKPDRGTVLIDGQTLGSRNMKERISLCPQFDIQWSILTVYEHLKIFGLLKGLSGPRLEKQINEVLAAIRLTDHRDQPVGTLSGGMRRRCSLGMSLIGDVTIVFLDEPTTGLDPKRRREFWQMILSWLTRHQVQQDVHHQHPPDGRGRVSVRPGRHHQRGTAEGHRHFGLPQDPVLQLGPGGAGHREQQRGHGQGFCGRNRRGSSLCHI